MDRIGIVFSEKQKVGTISEANDGYRFRYDPKWKQVGFPIGFAFPLNQDIFYSSDLFPFFENMLSEGWLRQIQSHEERIDSSDSFGFLLANGEDLPGAFTIRKEQ